MTRADDYSGDAYRACLYGKADRQQQQSAASQIILLHGIKGELLRALQMMLALNGSEAAKTQARIALTRAIPCGECHLPPGEECDICGKTQP